MDNTKKADLNFGFYLHFLVTLLALIGPFLFDWRLMALAYIIVHLQYMIFKKCLMNSSHGLDESEDPNGTFYGVVFDMVGIKHDKARLKKFLRGPLYPILGIFGYVWQRILEIPPLFF